MQCAVGAFSNFWTSGILQEPPAITACSPTRVLCSPATLSSRSIHTHPFHLLSLKGSLITHRSPVDGRRQSELTPLARPVHARAGHPALCSQERQARARAVGRWQGQATVFVAGRVRGWRVQVVSCRWVQGRTCGQAHGGAHGGVPGDVVHGHACTAAEYDSGGDVRYGYPRSAARRARRSVCACAHVRGWLSALCA